MTRVHPGLIGAAALAALIAGGATAQTYYQPSAYDQPAYTTGDITVYAPRYQPRTNEGAPTYRVRASRLAHMGDLDLSTYWGAREARARIERAAREACDQVDPRFPMINDPSGPDCMGGAVRHAMYEAEYSLGFTPPTWPNYE
ncbi:MAG TPA: UrcA family protein [Caulobacteraceae bacterium]|jgi:UrcA family protein|nr:UrcA family protein [Caulobacteraceae bacterium]